MSITDMQRHRIGPDKPDRPKPEKKVFLIPYHIMGCLEIVAVDESEAWAAAIQISKHELASLGELEMLDPEEKGHVQ